MTLGDFRKSVAGLSDDTPLAAIDDGLGNLVDVSSVMLTETAVMKEKLAGKPVGTQWTLTEEFKKRVPESAYRKEVALVIH